MMTHSALFLFTGKCLAMDENPSVREEVVSAISGGSVPWEEFVWTGSSHYVLPALYTAFERNGILPLLPDDLTEHLQNIYTLNAARNKRILVQCRHIAALLSPADIRPVFFKGAALLLMGLYQDPGDRLMEDIDILLLETEIPEALDLLLKGGYVPHPVEEGKEEAYTDHHHLPPMYHPGQVATLEIHRYPVHEEYRKLIREEAVLQEAVPTEPFAVSAITQEAVPPQPLAGKVGPLEAVPAGETSAETLPERSSGNHPVFVASPRHAGVLVYLHEHRMGRGFLSSAGTLKGAFDFYLLSKLRPPEPGDLPEGKFRKKYLQYTWSVEKIMDVSLIVLPPEDSTQKKLNLRWHIELYLLNHPRIDHFCHEYFYAPALFLKLMVSSIWSATDRKLAVEKLRKKSRLK